MSVNISKFSWFFLKKRALILGLFAVPFLWSCAHRGMSHHSMNHDHSAHAHHAAENTEKKSVLNTVIEDRVFSPLNAEKFKLSDFKNKKAIVFVMREQDCPISEKYGPRLARIEKAYSAKGVQFIYNYVGQVRKKITSRSDLKRFNFKGPYVLEGSYEIVKILSAYTTGDIFILTPDRRVIYRGPLDDQYHLLKSAIKVRNHYVTDVLDTVLSGQTIVPKELPAPGCIISPPLT